MKIEIPVHIHRLMKIHKYIISITRLAPLTHKAIEDEGIVSTFGNKRFSTAMSAHRILGVKKLPRVRLFAG